MGLSKVRFKAEVDFDGRVVTRSYLERQDIDQILNVSYLLATHFTDSDLFFKGHVRKNQINFQITSI